MKNCYGLTLIALGAALLPCTASLAQTDDPPSYVVYDTGTLGGTFAFGAGVNNLGWVSGASNTSSGALHAALSIPGNVIDLGTLGGTNSAVEWPVKNNHGLIVGISQTMTPDPLGESFSCADFIPPDGHTCVPFLWQNGALSQLPLLGGNNGFATGINNNGQAVGWAETAVHDPSCVHPQQVLQFLAVQWDTRNGNRPQVLAPLAGDSTSAATAINEAGTAVGISGACDLAVGAFSARNAVLWRDGKPVKLPTLGGKGWNTPMAINNRGIIAGFSDTPGDVQAGVLTPNNQAVVWTAEGIVNLHALAGDATAQATGINDRNQVVGTSFAANNASRVFYWENGRIWDLNTLLQANAPLYLIGTGDINDHGEITGYACVVADPNCTVVHTFVAIRAPRASDAAAAREPLESAARPVLSADLRERLLRLRGFGTKGPQAVLGQ